MNRSPRNGDSFDRLAALDGLLAAADRFVNEIRDDPDFVRLVDLFRRMPAADRGIILGMLEREVNHRVVNAKMASMTGFSLTPDPNARIYLRVYSSATSSVSGRDRDDMMIASLRSLKAMPQVLDPNVHDEWRAAAREAGEQLDARELAAAQRVLSEMLAILSECRPTRRTVQERANRSS